VDDPYTRIPAGTGDSMDERDVEAMLLAQQEEADRSMRYDDEQHHQHQHGDEDMESEEDLGFIQLQWPLL
jgi:hypothetical protein